MKYQVTLLFLWVLCVLARPIRRSAKHVPSLPTHVLIVQNAHLGDMVCTTPMFRALKQKYPQVHLSVMGNEVNRQLLEGSTDVDSYVTFLHVQDVYTHLKQTAYDVVITPVPNMVAAALAYIAGKPCIIVPRIVRGYSPFETFLYRSLRRIAGFVVLDHDMSSYAPREYLRLLEPLGVKTEDTKKHLRFSREAEQTITQFFENQKISNSELIIGMSVTAGHKVKQWPTDRFAKVIDHLAQKYQARIVIVGSGNDQREIERTLDQVGNKERVINAHNLFILDELKAFIARCDMFVSADTGPIYIAEAFDVPTIDIVGPVSERVQPPVGGRHLVVVPSSPREPQLFVMNARRFDMQEALRQIESTSTESVIAGCEELLSRIRPRTT